METEAVQISEPDISQCTGPKGCGCALRQPDLLFLFRTRYSQASFNSRPVQTHQYLAKEWHQDLASIQERQTLRRDEIVSLLGTAESVLKGKHKDWQITALWCDETWNWIYAMIPLETGITFLDLGAASAKLLELCKSQVGDWKSEGKPLCGHLATWSI